MKKLLALGALLVAGPAFSVMTVGDVTINGDGSVDLVTEGASDTDIENVLGAAPGSLGAFADDVIGEGSAIASTLQIFNGDIISFDWSFFTNEAFESSVNDFAFVYLTGEGYTTLADTFTIDPVTFEDAGTYSTIYRGASGMLTLGVGVVDIFFVDFESFLTVDNLTIVPTPAPLLLLGLGLVGLGAARRRA